ncbi:MAG: hypothetical protein GEV06_06885 [Luteitalea sp.]|nr:hypothetical protein [Luteitalea sp.]
MDYDGWRPYVPVATRRRRAARVLAGLKQKGHEAAPVLIDGRKITSTFWGKAWCENLERYSDFQNRLPRGRTYVRNGSVIDLQISPGDVTSLVSGSDLYRVRIGVAALPKLQWRGICRDCTGAIDSVVELLQGRLSTSVMARICEPKKGLFPAPREISFRCSCPDWARMCKHVAAVLYGIGARLDERPELLFLLRGVDQQDLIAKAGTGLQPSSKRPAAAKVLEAGDLAEIFGIDIAQSEPAEASPVRRKRTVRAGAAAGAKPAVGASTKPIGQTVPKRATRSPLRASRSRGSG